MLGRPKLRTEQPAASSSAVSSDSTVKKLEKVSASMTEASLLLAEAISELKIIASTKEVAASTPDFSQATSLGPALVMAGIITVAQLAEASALQGARGESLAQVLTEMGFVRQDVVIQFLVKQCKVPHLSLIDYEISKDVLDLIPKELCLRHCLLPIEKLGRTLTVAMVDPMDAKALEEIKEELKKHNPDLRIKPILCNWQHFKTVADKLFGGEPVQPLEAAAIPASKPPDEVQPEKIAYEPPGAARRMGTATTKP